MGELSEKSPLCYRSMESTRENNGGARGFDCGRCGKFKVHVPLIGNLKANERIQLSGVTREATELNRERVLITLDNYQELLAMAPTRIPDRAIRLLSVVARRTKFFGEWKWLHLEDDVPLAYAQNSDEFNNLLNYLRDTGLVELGPRTMGSTTLEVRITPKGFETLEARVPTGLESDSAFVAMWFDESIGELLSKVVDEVS